MRLWEDRFSSTSRTISSHTVLADQRQNQLATEDCDRPASSSPAIAQRRHRRRTSDDGARRDDGCREDDEVAARGVAGEARADLNDEHGDEVAQNREHEQDDRGEYTREYRTCGVE